MPYTKYHGAAYLGNQLDPLLITADPALAESTDQSGATPLLFSIYSQKPQSTEALRQCGVTPNIVEAAAAYVDPAQKRWGLAELLNNAIDLAAGTQTAAQLTTIHDQLIPTPGQLEMPGDAGPRHALIGFQRMLGVAFLVLLGLGAAAAVFYSVFAKH